MQLPIVSLAHLAITAAPLSVQAQAVLVQPDITVPLDLVLQLKTMLNLVTTRSLGHLCRFNASLEHTVPLSGKQYAPLVMLGHTVTIWG